jgi:4-hydroxythreonine-4-phosphate dehydrogenase
MEQIVESRGRPAQHPLAVPPLALTPLALTMGDPAGIGIEITLAAWRGRTGLSLPAFCLFGDAEVVAGRAIQCGIDVPVCRVSSLQEAAACFPAQLPVWHVPGAAASVPGKPDARNGRAVIAAIDLAVSAVVRGDAAALVTNPIAKHVLHESGFRHPGHTEYLGALAAEHNPGRTFTPVMMLAADDPLIRVVPLTVHEPIARVPGLITQALIIETTRITHRALVEQFGIARPRIAIAGLNPHAGEHGSIGTEDRDIIAPAIARLLAAGLAVSGPHSADTLFHGPARATYDAVIAMYHDQALIPIKTLAFDTGVNLTLGLPFVRTSPDHGTAFDIAGRGTASPSSLIAALKMAAALGAKRAALQPQSPAL